MYMRFVFFSPCSPPPSAISRRGYSASIIHSVRNCARTRQTRCAKIACCPPSTTDAASGAQAQKAPPGMCRHTPGLFQKLWLVSNKKGATNALEVLRLARTLWGPWAAVFAVLIIFIIFRTVISWQLFDESGRRWRVEVVGVTSGVGLALAK